MSTLAPRKQDPRIPGAQSASYRAAAMIYERGPLSEADIFVEIDFGTRNGNRRHKLEASIVKGWLCDMKGNKIGLSRLAKKHFDSLAEPASKPSSDTNVAQPRIINRMSSPPLSKRFIPDRDGPRGRVDWAVRSPDHHFFTQA